jgi:hypothetical protein
MKIKVKIKAVVMTAGILLLAMGWCGSVVAKQPQKGYNVAAYVWPSCHNDPRGQEILWPEGIGEWEVIKKGNPRYAGHYQPKQPLWGYEMDNDPTVVEKWIDVALDHGVNTFIYDWYWFDGGPFLESALNDGFLGAPNNKKMQFYLMWANHDVKYNYWNYHRYPDNESQLWDGATDWDNFRIIVERVIKQYFGKPNYFKIDGKPVFAIFSLENLYQTFNNSTEEIRKALSYFDEQARKAGFGGVHFQYIPGGGWLSSEEDAKREAEHIKSLGFNSTTFYNMGGINEDYIAYGTNSVAIREQWDRVLDMPFFPCVSVGWDDTPRFPAYGMEQTVHYNNSPTSFATLLSKAKKYADEHPDQPKLITINAWNEWVEGSYLLPDMKYGFGYLEAVRDVMEGKYDRYEKP